MTSKPNTTPLHIRIPGDLKEQAQVKADSNYLSLTQYVVQLIRDDLKAKRPTKRKTDQHELDLSHA